MTNTTYAICPNCGNALHVTRPTRANPNLHYPRHMRYTAKHDGSSIPYREIYSSFVVEDYHVEVCPGSGQVVDIEADRV